jgi:superfamily II DNA or RNA helicase
MDLSKCRVKYLYLWDENGRPLQIVANHGLKKYEKSYVARGGEYSDFCIQAMDDIPPILTNHHVQLALDYIKKNNFDKAAISLNIWTGYQMYGEQLVLYVVDGWLAINGFEQMFVNKIDDEFLEIIKNDRAKIDQMIKTQRHHPINGRIKIVDIGANIKTREPVVPPEWIGRVFDSAHTLHAEMSNLPSRKGKPPVSFCCIYSNAIKKENTWINDQKLVKNDIVYKISLDANHNITTTTEVIQNDTIFQARVLKTMEKNKFISVDPVLIEGIPGYKKFPVRHTVGYLSSLLQKCIRRGPENGSLLEKTIQQLNCSRPYNVPEHNYAQTSGTRQLLWRSYISIIEDVKGFTVDYQDNTYSIDLMSMVLLGIICQLDSKIQLSRHGLEPIIKTMLLVQEYDQKWNWHDYPDQLQDPDQLQEPDNHINPGSIQSSIKLALKNMPMMQNDRIMLSRTYNLLHQGNVMISDLSEIRSKYHPVARLEQDPGEQKQTICQGIDMHCNPGMLIELQGMVRYRDASNHPIIPYIPTLDRLAGYIWNNFSKINFRDPMPCHTPLYGDHEIKKYALDKQIVKSLDNNLYLCVARLQEYLMFGRPSRQTIDWLVSYDRKTIQYPDPDLDPMHRDRMAGRVAWLLLFGQKYRYKYKNKMYDVLMGGKDQENLCKIKKMVQNKSEYVEGELRKTIQDNFLKDFASPVKIKLPGPPEYYVWNFISKPKHYVTIRYRNNKFYVDNEPVQCLDLLNNIQPIKRSYVYNTMLFKTMPDELIACIKTVCYAADSDDQWDQWAQDLLFVLSDITYYRRLVGDYRVWDWTEQVTGTGLPCNIWRLVLARIWTNDIDGKDGKFVLQTGPCDRTGHRTNNSISYKYEGTLYRLFILLEALYPFMLRRIRESMRWTVNKTVPEYRHMIESLKYLADNGQKYKYQDESIIKINTKLWEHQVKTIDRMFHGMTVDGRRGYGDASHVGAGKSLCALGLMRRLYDHNYQKVNMNSCSWHSYAGFLILVPSIPLTRTWKDEVMKHTDGFDTYIQDSNGTFLDMKNKRSNIIKITPNTLIITTMGRIRDHPVHHPWILVVIDECLSVQNKEALQTEEAWRQSCCSEYGIVMLSATFFRARFDKLFYMIKMLKTGLPETKPYLDTILSETMVSNVTESSRVWTIDTKKVIMTPDQRAAYDHVYLANRNKGAEKLYLALSQHIHESIDYVDIFFDQLDDLEQNLDPEPAAPAPEPEPDSTRARVLVFAKSKDEADRMIQSPRNISGRITRYPDKTARHCAVSVAEATYGLNDLVIYNTILIRALIEPDRMPQIKGRLDRHGQNATNLEIRYVLIQDTIEEAGIVRMEHCNNFYNNYLMPLAEFYELATKQETNRSNSMPGAPKEKIITPSKMQQTK